MIFKRMELTFFVSITAYRDQQLSQDISLGLLKNIALELCQISASTQGNGDVINQIQRYIAEHYTNANLSLTDISQKFNLSENYISSLFKKETDENFSSWLIRLRMAKAKELVTDSDLPLARYSKKPTAYLRKKCARKKETDKVLFDSLQQVSVCIS